MTITMVSATHFLEVWQAVETPLAVGTLLLDFMLDTGTQPDLRTLSLVLEPERKTPGENIILLLDIGPVTRILRVLQITEIMRVITLLLVIRQGDQIRVDIITHSLDPKLDLKTLGALETLLLDIRLDMTIRKEVLIT